MHNFISITNQLIIRFFLLTPVIFITDSLNQLYNNKKMCDNINSINKGLPEHYLKYHSK
jgi:hypothetical protein